MASQQIEKVCIQGCNLDENDQRASRDLAMFLCLLPCLTDLTIKDSDNPYNNLFLCDDFYHELVRQASSSKIEKVCIQGCHLNENDPTASRDLARFLCLLPCLTDLMIKGSDNQYNRHFHGEYFYDELARQASSSKIQKVCIQGCIPSGNDPTASRDLAMFLCLLPCLTDLTIKGSDDPYNRHFHGEYFYDELVRQASSSKIEKLCIQGCNLCWNDHTASCDLARFLCLLPCLTDLTIKDSDDPYNNLFLCDDFYHELARQASSSKIQKVCIRGCILSGNDPTASRDLAMFLCLLPCLTDLTIKGSDNPYNRHFHGEYFYDELARQASSSKIEKLCIQGCNLRGNDPTASRDLARFMCLLPCLTDLTIKDYDDQYKALFLHDDFYQELARQASSSKIEKVCIQGCNPCGNDHTASRDLARFLCLLPCLTDLMIKDSDDQYNNLFLCDDFYHELARQASSSKNPVFSNLMTRTTWYNEHRSRSVHQGPLAPLQMTNLQGRLPSQFEQPHQQYYTHSRTDVYSYLLRPQALHSAGQYQDIYRLSDPGEATGPQDYPPLWQSSHHPQHYQSLGDVPTAHSSQMINPHQGMTPTTRHPRQSPTSGTFLPPAITYHHNQQHQTHVPHHLPFSQTPVSQEAWQHPDQNRVGEPFLPFQQSRQQHQPIMSQSQELMQNLHQQLYFPRGPPQRETQSQLRHLSGSQQSEQPNQLSRRLGELQVHPCSQTAQHRLPRLRLPQPLLMTEQPRYFSTTHSSYYDDQRHTINPQQPMIHMIQQPTLLPETSTEASLPPASQSSFHRTDALHRPRQPHFSEFMPSYRLPQASRDPQHPNTHHNTVYTPRSPQPRHQQSP